MAYKQLKLWFDEELAAFLSHKIIPVAKHFQSHTFEQLVTNNIQDLELKDRVEFMADALHECLGLSYKENVKVLLEILGPENEKETGMFKEFYWIMPIAKLIEKYGLDDFKISMRAIEEITKRNTGEYTIRPFLVRYTKSTLAQMLKWSKSSNKHVRRLASEGVRPRLPWAQKLNIFIEDPVPILPILENLKDDSSKYVQKSVANCLNDVLKDNPEIARSVIEKWNQKPSKERKWIIKHALRNLIKANDQWALACIR